VAWIVLVILAVRAMAPYSWSGLRDRAHGGWELASVATSGVVILATDVSRVAAAVLWVLALAVYIVMTWLILWRRAAFAPDHWILMGGLAIATLAGTQLHIALVVATWLLATAWIPVLAYLTMRRRPALVQFSWWAMVFPLGMYASATYATAMQTGWKQLAIVSLAFVWVALAAWLVIALVTLMRFRRVLTR
jgi:tellurite resistance protein TehA-like permease